MGELNAQNWEKNGFGNHIITMVKVVKDEGKILKSVGPRLLSRYSLPRSPSLVVQNGDSKRTDSRYYV